MNYREVTTPATAEDIEDMYQCINQTYLLAVLLKSLNETEDADVFAIIGIGKVLKNLLSQPLEAACQLTREKPEHGEGVVAEIGGAS